MPTGQEGNLEKNGSITSHRVSTEIIRNIQMPALAADFMLNLIAYNLIRIPQTDRCVAAIK